MSCPRQGTPCLRIFPRKTRILPHGLADSAFALLTVINKSPGPKTRRQETIRKASVGRGFRKCNSCLWKTRFPRAAITFPKVRCTFSVSFPAVSNIRLPDFYSCKEEKSHRRSLKGKSEMFYAGKVRKHKKCAFCLGADHTP